MNDVEQRKAAKEFSEFWQGKGYEKGQSQQFWMSLLSNVFGIEKPEEFISFEDQVKLDHTSFIDASIPATHVLIEQKSIDKELMQLSNNRTVLCLRHFNRPNAMLLNCLILYVLVG